MDGMSTTTTRDTLQSQVEQAADRIDAETKVAVVIPDDLDQADYTVLVDVVGERETDKRGVARDLVDAMALPDVVTDVQITDAGQINVFVDRNVLVQEIVDSVQEITFEEQDETVVVEYPILEPQTPLQMGDLRGLVLGDTLARIADTLGDDVETHLCVTDTGRQPATMVYAYRNFYDELSDADQENPDDVWIGLLYTKADQHLTRNVADNAHVETIRQELADDPETQELRDELVANSVRGQLSTAFRSNVTCDVLIFEQDMVSSGLYDDGFEQLKTMDAVYEAKNREDRDCIVLDISDYEDALGELMKPYKILQRSNGTVTRITKDLVKTLWQYGTLDTGTDLFFREFAENPDRTPVWRSGGSDKKQFGDTDQIITVGSADQAYAQTLQRYGLKALGLDGAFNRFDHVPFDLVYLTDSIAEDDDDWNSPWAGRYADVVLDQVYALALEDVTERHGDTLSRDALEYTADTVATAAVRYALLDASTDKDITFSIEDALDRDGDSGPHLLTSLHRAHDLLTASDGRNNFQTVEHGGAYMFSRELERYTDVVETSFAEQDPSQITGYLVQLTEQFDAFQKTTLQSEEDDPLRDSWMALVAAYATVMAHGLGLLGIDPLDL